MGSWRHRRGRSSAAKLHFSGRTGREGDPGTALGGVQRVASVGFCVQFDQPGGQLVELFVGIARAVHQVAVAALMADIGEDHPWPLGGHLHPAGAVSFGKIDALHLTALGVPVERRALQVIGGELAGQ